MTDALPKLDRITTVTDMMNANAALMTEVYTDRKLTAQEKMRSFTAGVRNQVNLSRDLAARRAELFRYGQKADATIKSLAFDPLGEGS